MAGTLCTDFETSPPLVTEVEVDDVGGFSMHFGCDFKLDLFPDTSFGPTEHWRIFRPSVHDPHFVVPAEKEDGVA